MQQPIDGKRLFPLDINDHEGHIGFGDLLICATAKYALMDDTAPVAEGPDPGVNHEDISQKGGPPIIDININDIKSQSALLPDLDLGCMFLQEHVPSLLQKFHVADVIDMAILIKMVSPYRAFAYFHGILTVMGSSPISNFSGGASGTKRCGKVIWMEIIALPHAGPDNYTSPMTLLTVLLQYHNRTGRFLGPDHPSPVFLQGEFRVFHLSRASLAAQLRDKLIDH